MNRARRSRSVSAGASMDAPKAAVFLSYASADAASARRIADALRAAGVETWLDESALRGGDAWDAEIRRQIRDCALFVPIVSTHTEARSEGYFRLEWRLAIERSRLIADDRPFLLPVVVDDTRETGASVPDAFLERQWTRLGDARSLDAFAAHVKRLLGNPRASMPHARAPAPAARTRIRFVAAGIFIAAIAIAGVLLGTHRSAVSPSAGASADASQSTLSPTASPKAIAVLPFDNLSGRPEDAYLADGLQEEILNALARMRDLTVISRASTREYRGATHNLREIGRRLGVGSVLEGSIRRDGNTLRLTVQLVDARDDRQVFAVNYDSDLGHVLDLQSKVARKVADALSATLTQYERGELDRVPTNNGDAYDRYLHAIALMRQEAPDDELGVVEPKRLLREALVLDPEFAEAWALLSQAHGWTYFATSQAEEGVAAKDAFERAFAIDPELADARLARGIYELYVARDLDAAIADFTEYSKLRPSSGVAEAMLGFALRRKGRFDEAIPHFDRAWVLDPLNEAYSGGTLTTLLALRRYPEAIARIDIYRSRFPTRYRSFFTQARIEGQIRGGDIAPLKHALAEYGHLLDEAGRTGVLAEIARGEGRFLDAVALWEKIPDDGAIERHQTIGSLYWAAGEASNAEREFAKLERASAEVLKEHPDDLDALTLLAIAQSMRGAHEAALATVAKAGRGSPQADDLVNGPRVDFTRAVVLYRAGRVDEAHAEVERLLRTPFGAPVEFFGDPPGIDLLVRDDARFDELLHHPPRL